MDKSGNFHVSNKDSNPMPLKALVRVASIAAGVSFSWSLQFSLLTPYVQELGFSHTFASYVWLCGPVSGLLVQPIVGLCSDRCPASWGRRRPFIVVGASFVVVAELLIGFSSDIGYMLGDSLQSKTLAITVFIVGFWMLDISNNALQIPCRALLADFTGTDGYTTRQGNAYFSFFMAVGNMLGFATSSISYWSIIFPFTRTCACSLACSNLKSAFLVSILLLISTTFLSITAIEEIPWSRDKQKSNNHDVSLSTHLLSTTSKMILEYGKNQNIEDADSKKESLLQRTAVREFIDTIKNLPKEIRSIVLVNALTLFAFFSFSLFATDWMGREIYGGNPISKRYQEEQLYIAGVEMGSLGLMLGSIGTGLCSLLIEPLCKRINSNHVWASANFLMGACLASMIVISFASQNSTSYGESDPPISIRFSSTALVSILGVHIAITSSLPYALAATLTSSSDGGQGFSVSVLNLAIVLPQFLISIGGGPWDALFGGGNLPLFTLASGISLLSGILAILILPKTSHLQEFHGGISSSLS